MVGVELADAIEDLLGDRRSATTAKQLVDAARKANRLSAETEAFESVIGAAVYADNMRCERAGNRPRFALSNGRIGLTRWGLDGELARTENEIFSKLERYRESFRRSLLRRLQDLPSRALGELIILLLERMDVSQARPVRRPGTPASEMHLSAKRHGAAGEIPTAIIVRRDAKEIGRELVTELRGALHHYDSASAGLIITTGQVLKGAREEADVAGATPVALIDGMALATLCDEHGVGVLHSRIDLPAPDVEFLATLRG